MRATDVVRPIAKQSATSAQREARRGQTGQSLCGLFRLGDAISKLNKELL